MAFKARRLSSGWRIPYTPVADVGAGDVIEMGTIPMVSELDISANELGDVTAGGLYSVEKDTSIFAAGDAVYWDNNGNSVGGVAGEGCATSTASGNNLMGVCTEAAGTSVEHVKVKLTAAKRTTTIAGSMSAEDITGSDSDLGIAGKAGAAGGAGGTITGLGGAGDTNGAGGAVNYKGGAGAGTGAGGAATFAGGVSGGGATGNGGAASLAGGAATSTAGTGGAVSVTGGVGTTTGLGGAASLTGGAGGNVSAGGTGAAGGAVTVTSGAGGTTATGTGGASGALAVASGAGGAASGAGTGGAGGAVTVTGGAGGATTTSTGGAGATITLTAGAGGAASGAGTGGAGGNVNLVPGTGGTTSGGTSGADGEIQFNGGGIDIAAYSMGGLATPTATNCTFFLATKPYRVKAVKAIWDVAAGSTSTIDIIKDTSTNAIAGGTSILAAALSINSTARTVATPSLSATASVLLLAAGDRLSLKYNHAIQSTAGLFVQVELAPK